MTSSPKRKNRAYSPTVRPRKGKKKGNAKKKKSSTPVKKTKAVDVVTGKATVEYFFDPTLQINTSTSSSGNETPFKVTKSDDDALIFQSKHLFFPCKIIKPLNDENSLNSSKELSGQPFAGPTLVKTSDGTLHKIRDSTLLKPLQTDDYLGMEDVLHLKQITEASLLHTLRLRYKRDDIYTLAGPILIAINPYQNIVLNGGESLYSENRMMAYRSSDSPAAPHLFQIADRAYTALMDSVHLAIHDDNDDTMGSSSDYETPGAVRNQSIIISGESGAGKTEATKIIMRYLARITRKTELLSPSKKAAAADNVLMSPNGKMVAALEDRVLSSNPLLETFGNAQTLRNDNSSRFGKFINIYFDLQKGGITGASISNYLLEKTRVTTQVDGERNYHVFYQLLQDSSLCRDFGLDGGAFNYLKSPVTTASTDHDAASLKETMTCLNRIGLTEEEQRAVFGVAAAVLHIGNITFEAPDEHSDASVSSSSLPSLRKACELLGLDEEKLAQALLTKVLNVNGKTIQKPQNVALAQDKRDALAKMTYSFLFVWLVECVNETLQATSNTTASDGFIGVLDIYGFECFETNGLEQLLINYCNEKLQRHFNRHLFEVEQELYANEGVDWSYISFNDNRPCLELIEGGGVCIINTLDDAWGGMGSSTEKDSKFVVQLHKHFGTAVGGGGGQSSNSEKCHPNFVTPKFGNDKQFIVVHYAGEVRYTADGFVEKNMETMSNEIRDLGDQSSVALAKRVYASGQSSNDTAKDPLRSSIRGISVSSQFRSSLQALVSDLDRTQPHYIRCIKPNLKKAPGSFQSGEVLKQLRYSGMMEAIRIRREGYALREEHESFYARFSVLLNQDELDAGDSGIEQLVKVLSNRLSVTDADWQIGHSKIFLRRELSDKLERLATLRVRVAARSVGRFGKRVVFRRLAKFLTAWVRFRLIVIQKRRRQKAATKLSASFRGYQQRLAFRSAIRAVTKLQSVGRRQVASQKVRLLRDPYCEIDFRQLKKLVKTEQERLDAAVAEKDFRLATEIETKVVTMQAALEKKRPITRKTIESKIADIQKELEASLARKDFAACGPLQENLDKLVQQRADLPTVEELRNAVKEAEMAITEAAKNRDFASAAEGQQKVDDARKRLADVLAAENDDDDEEGVASDEKDNLLGFESRAQLEFDLKDIAAQVKESIDNKDFKKAALLQQALDERAQLRKHFPSIQDLEAELEQLKASLQDALSKNAFSRAEKLDASVVELEAKIGQEKAKMEELGISDTDEEVSFTSKDGVKKVFESRGDLEIEIKAIGKSVSDAVKEKQFKKADSLQADVDALSKLRERLPSIAELQAKLDEKKKEMDSAISSKQFAAADEINSEVVDLEAKLKHEKSLLPKPAETPKKAAPDAKSVRSLPVATASISAGRSVKTSASAPAWQTPKKVDTFNAKSQKTVSKLRPAKAILSDASYSIRGVTELLAKKRANAVMVVDSEGGLSGIVTDTDVTRRVVAKYVDADSTCIQDVMTPNPTCVSTSDPAMSALTIMVENRFRHLPVVDDSGAVVGLLDIAKCLNDAISKLEKAQGKSKFEADDAVKQLVSQQGANGAQAAAMQALLGTLMSQAFGEGGSPTLRSVLAERPSTIVSSTTSIREAAVLMADRRKAALVVDNNRLVGIFGFKDMMNRAVAKGLDVDSVSVADVMTPEPDFVSPDITVLEALQTMHDNKFLTLPVCEANGEVVGLVDVMDVIFGCGGAKGWQSMFSSAMEIDDDVSDVTSVNSVGKSTILAGRHDRTSMKAVAESEEERPVSKLRPAKPMLSRTDDNVMRVSQMLASKRGAASLVVGTDGSLGGIITDTDITRRVVAQDLDASATAIETVMTPNPTCVSTSDSAMDALMTMVENHFRHLPVVDDGGSVVGLLDIAKCLNDAISRLEKFHGSKKENSAADAVQKLVGQNGAADPHTAALQALLGQMMSKAFGSVSLPTLGSLLEGKESAIVSSSATIREAGYEMASKRKAVLVVDEGKLSGIFGFKDMMSRAVAKGRDLDNESVLAVMTENPEYVSSDVTVLEALQTMHDSGFLNLPVCNDDGTVLGLVGVMDLINGCGGADGWRSIFSSAMEIGDDQSETGSIYSRNSRASRRSAVKSKQSHSKTVAKLRPAKPHLSSSTDSVLAVTQLLLRKRGDASIVLDVNGALSGIITDTDITRRVVAQHVDAGSTSIVEVMTPNPTCVKESDSAIDALTTMVENHFRHVPVINASGGVVGLLDIAKCLNDAISKLERSHDKSSAKAEDAAKQLVAGQGMKGKQAEALQSMLGSLMSQALGNSPNPTLRSILAERPSTIVEPASSIREAGMKMAENRKAALVVDDGHLVGIFGFKDMMTRAVAKEVDLDNTEVSSVMTHDPEFVSPEMTALEALQIMHDNKFLTLPVCEADGAVVGLVDVMDVIYGCGGLEGWKSIFSNTMEMDDLSASPSPSRLTALQMSTIKAAPDTPYVNKLPGNIPATLEFDNGEDNGSFNGSTIGDERGVSKLLSADDISGLVTSVGVFKISAPDGTTHRVRCPTRVDDLFDAVTTKANIPRESLQLEFTDDEGDVVIVTSDDDVVEAWAFARKAGQKIAKLNAVVKQKTNTALYAGGAGLAIAAIGAIGFFLLRPKRP